MPHLRAAIEAFPPHALRGWSEALGSRPSSAPAAGVSGGFKASPLLRAWLRRLDAAGVQFALRHRWTGWEKTEIPAFQTPEGPRAIDAARDRAGAGGASWPRLGSDGSWVDRLAAKAVKISTLRPANSGFTVAWSEIFRDRFEGQPLKGVAFRSARTPCAARRL